MLRTLVAPFAVAALLATTNLPAAPATAPSRLFEGKDLFSLQIATDPQITVTGSETAMRRIAAAILTALDGAR